MPCSFAKAVMTFYYLNILKLKRYCFKYFIIKVPSFKCYKDISKETQVSGIYALSILVETRVLAFSVVYCSLDRQVNLQIITMKFVHSFLERLLLSQNNFVLNLSWIFEQTRRVFPIVNLYLCINFKMALCREMSIEDFFFSNVKTDFNEASFSWLNDEL